MSVELESKKESGLVLWFIHILKTVYIQQFKGIQSSKLARYVKRVQLSNRRYPKRILALS